MRLLRTVLLGGLLWSAPLAIAQCPAMAATGHWSASEVADLRSKPRITRRDGGVTASFFVTATPARAYQILTDHPHLPEFMPNLDACRIRKEGPNWAEIEMKNSKGTMVLRREFDPPHLIRWKLVEAAMLKRVDGSWRLDGVEGGTVLTYDSEVETSVPVPGFIIQFVQQDSLNALIANVRQRVDSNGTWTKPGFTKGRPE